MGDHIAVAEVNMWTDVSGPRQHVQTHIGLETV